MTFSLHLLYLDEESDDKREGFFEGGGQGKDKKKHSLKPVKCKEHFLSLSSGKFQRNTDMHEL